MKTAAIVAAFMAAVLVTTLARAQSAGPRDLAELKQETQRRADRNLPPIGGVKPEDVREALAGLTSLEPDAWATAFSRIGDSYVERARMQQASAPREAAENYHHAWEVFNTARWPVENSPGKKQAYVKSTRSVSGLRPVARAADRNCAYPVRRQGDRRIPAAACGPRRS